MFSKLKLKKTKDNHCEMRIHERNITFHHLNVTVAAYDSQKSQENGRLRFSKRFGDQVMDVIVSATTSAAYSIGRIVTSFPRGEGKMAGIDFP